MFRGRKILIFTLLLFLIFGIFIIIKIQKSHKVAVTSQHSAVSKQIYYCPMHPNYTSDRPGECPICGMSLVLKKEAVSTKLSAVSEKGEVFISPEKQQLIGVKTDTVKYLDLQKKIQAKGLVEYDERKTFNVTTKIEGYIEKLFVNYTGKFVKKGDALFTIYSPELVSAQQEYLLALKSKNISQNSEFPEIKKSSDELIISARKRLKFWDISDTDIKNLEKTGEVKKTLTIHSPYSGFVIDKMAIEGAKIMPGDILYKIADISSVWVVADVYEQDIPYVKLGQVAKISLLSMPNKIFFGKVSYIYPYLEPETRTIKIRIEIANKNFILKPNMYASVEINIDLGEKLSVLDTAVIDTGERQVVILSKGNGYFKPVEVKLGAKVENYYEVLSGLKEGDEVVTNANFLIDSESNMKEALSGMGHD